MSRLIDKLVKVAGGWENFLYETLKDVQEIYNNMAGSKADEYALVDAFDEVQEILAAYENARPNIANPSQSPSIKVQKDTTDVSKVKVEVKPASQPEESGAEPEEKQLPPPKSERGLLNVDPYAGACQGELPIPIGCKLVNRVNIVVTTTSGLELGRSAEDGQIRGQGVSGHVNVSGKFRLVFIDTDLGTGIMHYQIQQQEANNDSS